MNALELNEEEKDFLNELQEPESNSNELEIGIGYHSQEAEESEESDEGNF